MYRMTWIISVDRVYLQRRCRVLKCQAQNQGGFRGGRDANMQINRNIQMDMGLALLLKNQEAPKRIGPYR